MNPAFTEHLRAQLRQLESDGLLKRERVITTPQGAWVEADGKRVVNLCANNYLGLAGRPELVQAAQAAPRRAAGSASRRCASSAGRRTSTRSSRRALAAVPRLRGRDPLLVVLRRERRRVRGAARRGGRGHLRRAQPRLDHRRHPPVQGAALPLRERRHGGPRGALREADAAGARFKLDRDRRRLLDGRHLANLPAICDLAERYGALVMVDDSHAVGFIGEQGRGTPEHHGVMGRVDLVTGTLGKALGGASGGYVAGSREVVEWLRQTARPYLFSNTLAAGDRGGEPRRCSSSSSGATTSAAKLRENAAHFRAEMTRLGFELAAAASTRSSR